MPKFDATGPFGYGPGTGRGFDPCSGICYGRGRGSGYRRFYTKKEEAGLLKEEAETLAEELKAVKERLTELEDQK
ncbi:MAG: DUF5320 domain-containing protein [Candidatus Pacebacteria bacterium]|nr:DUF5320 domain-containing protein [Candidatus Paceibacterota bacterium]